MNFKRIALSLLCVFLLLTMILCTVACDQKPSEPSDDEDVSADTNSIFTVRYNGAVIELGKDASAILKKLGEPSSKQFVASCGEGAGDQWQYMYPSIVLFTVKNGEQEIVDAVVLRDDIAKTHKNITVGATEAEMIAAYGDPIKQGQKCRYTEGKNTLEFGLDDTGCVKTVEIRTES